MTSIATERPDARARTSLIAAALIRRRRGLPWLRRWVFAIIILPAYMDGRWGYGARRGRFRLPLLHCLERPVADGWWSAGSRRGTILRAVADLRRGGPDGSELVLAFPAVEHIVLICVGGLPSAPSIRRAVISACWFRSNNGGAGEERDRRSPHAGISRAIA